MTSLSGRAVALVCGLACAVVGRAGAQGAQPLRKTDVVRLLASPLIGKAEVADLIRRNCLAFRPTERDWADLRALGADADVLSSVGGCTERPAAARAAPAPLLAVPLLAQVTAQAGGEAVASVLLKRGGLVQAGVQLLLRSYAETPDLALPDARAVTDENGVAEFRFAAGRRAGAYTLTALLASGAAVTGARPITLTVRPAPPARVALQPAQLDVTAAADDAPLAIVATLTDSLGNLLPNEPVQLGGEALDRGPLIAATDSFGAAAFSFPRAAVRRAGTLAVTVRGERLAALPVLFSEAVSAEASGFASPNPTSGIVRKHLSEPLVFQVRSVAGRALPGRVVSFRGQNADVVPDSAVTDSAGQARVFVTLGMQAGLAVVTGSVDSMTKRLELRIEPSAEATLTIEQNGTRVDGGQIVVPVDTAFALRVSARDAYGNAVVMASLVRALEDMRAQFNREPTLLRIVRVDADSSAATVTFFPTALGRATLTIVDATVSVTVVRSKRGN